MKVADILLKDGTMLNRCAIYNEGIRGEEALNDEGLIKEKFQVMPWGNEWRDIKIQTHMMNAFIPVSNVKSFTIYDVETF